MLKEDKIRTLVKYKKKAKGIFTKREFICSNDFSCIKKSIQ